jgi:hypothetical protein
MIRLKKRPIRGQWGVQVRVGGRWVLTALRKNKRDNALRARHAERLQAGGSGARVVFVPESRRRSARIEKPATAEVPSWARQLLETGKRRARRAGEAAATPREAVVFPAAESHTRNS